jgi:hypothetical protein
MVVFGCILRKMDDNILNAVGGFGIKEIKGVMRGRQMTVHAIGHKALGIIYMGRSFPGVVGKPNFMAGGAKLGC